MNQISIHPYTIRKVPLCQPVPPGWRMLARGEAMKWKSCINSMLTHWSIVALDVGKIDGHGYGNKISSSYGPECGEKFIICT